MPSMARIRTLGLLGDKYIEISSGSPKYPEVPEGGRIGTAPVADLTLGPLGEIGGQLAQVAAFFQAGVDGVKQRGGAAVGDKTCVDAMEPAAQKAAEVANASLADAVTAIAAATEAGKEASKAMVAKFGRAKTLGEACIGFPDAGACSVVVIVNAMRDYITA